MRSRRGLALASALVAGGIAFVTATSAQQAPASAQATTAAPTKDAPATDPAGTATTPTATGKAPASTPAPPRSPEHFEPTEKVRADFDVSFPVDI